MPLSEIVNFNPTYSIKKGTFIPYVEMAAVPENTREIAYFENREFSSGSKFKNGDTLFSRITPCLQNGKTARVSGLKESQIGNGSTEFIVMSAKDIDDKDFVYYLALDKEFRNYAEGRMEGTTGRQRVSWQALSEYEFLIPPKDVRQKIAHILSTLDDKIELNRKMNQTLESMASAIFKSWFVDFDPVHAKANCEDEAELENIAKELGISKAILDLFPSEFIESELGMIPKGWKIINFKDLVEKYIDNRGKTPPLVENGIPLLEVRTLPNEMLSSEYLTDKCVSDEIYNTWFRSHLETDDILISTVGTIGLTSIVPPNSKFVIAQNVLGIRANEEFILKKFMFYLMKSKFFIDAINARLVTTVQSSIKRKDMETINIIIPDFSTQKEFVKIVTPIMEKMQSNEILNLEKTRDTLLPKLLSGEIDVSDLSLEME